MRKDDNYPNLKYDRHDVQMFEVRIKRILPDDLPGGDTGMKNKYKCLDCNKQYPCWMIVEYPPINSVVEDHPVDKKLRRKCIMDRKEKANFILQVNPNVSK